MNQAMAKDIRRRQRKGHNPNAVKANKRRSEERLNRQTLQFKRSLDHMFEGHDDMDTPEARDVLLTIGKHEEVSDTYLTKKWTIVTITFVDLSCLNVINKKVT